VTSTSLSHNRAVSGYAEIYVLFARVLAGVWHFEVDALQWPVLAAPLEDIRTDQFCGEFAAYSSAAGVSAQTQARQTEQ